MKKTLIALMTLAGVVQAGSISLVHQYDMSGTLGESATTLYDSTGTVSLTGLGSLTATYNDMGGVTKTSGAGSCWSGSFTGITSENWALQVEFTTGDKALGGSLQSIISVWGEDEANEVNIQLANSTDGGAFGIGAGTNGYGTGRTYSDIMAASHTSYTLTLVNSATALTLLVDGIEAVTCTYGSSMPASAYAISNIKLGGIHGGTYGTISGVSYDDLRMYNTSANMSAVEVYNAINIPEPATATLSLLALAGLAVRRKRK